VNDLELGFYSDDLGGDFESSKGLEQRRSYHCGIDVRGPKNAALGEGVGGYLAREAVNFSPVAEFGNAQNGKAV
jgi:hypothetical protein